MAQGVKRNRRAPLFASKGKRRFWLASAALHAFLIGGLVAAFGLTRALFPAAPGPLTVSLYAPAPLPGERQAAREETSASSIATTTRRKAEPQEEKTPEADAPLQSVANSNDPSKTETETQGAEETAKALPSLQGVGEEIPARLAAGEGGGTPRPPYPRWARERRWEGRIALEIEVLASGRVGGVKILEGTGHARLDEFTVQWCKDNLVFEPATLGGIPIKTTYRVTYRYELT